MKKRTRKKMYEIVVSMLLITLKILINNDLVVLYYFYIFLFNLNTTIFDTTMKNGSFQK